MQRDVIGSGLHTGIGCKDALLSIHARNNICAATKGNVTGCIALQTAIQRVIGCNGDGIYICNQVSLVAGLFMQ